jgi:hypothetical protein
LIIHAFPFSGHFKHFENAARCGGDAHHLWNIEPRWEENQITLCDACHCVTALSIADSIKQPVPNLERSVGWQCYFGQRALGAYKPIAYNGVSRKGPSAFRQNRTQSCTSSGQHIQSRPDTMLCLKKTTQYRCRKLRCSRA